MFDVTISVRDARRLQSARSYSFRLPSLPRKGDVISIQRFEKDSPWGKDMVVEGIWWRLEDPSPTDSLIETVETGGLNMIVVECSPAIGPYSSNQWRDYVQHSHSDKPIHL